MSVLIVGVAEEVVEPTLGTARLLERVSVPARVARVPVVGKVTPVAAVTVNTVANAPATSKFPPIVIVLVELLTPVPP